MALTLELDRTEKQPLYQQIVEQVKQQIIEGQLPVGTRLPPVRKLATMLGVTRLTAHTAYSELQAEGWVEATVGRGTFIAQPPQPDPPVTEISYQATADAVLNNVSRFADHAGLRSLAYADPDPAFFPVEELTLALGGLREEMVSLLQYTPSQGDPLLRVELVSLLKERGIEAMPDEILLTSGATQALSLAAQAICRPGDSVLVEQPTFLGWLHILKMQGLQPIAVPLDEEGVDLDRLEQILRRQQPRLFYTIPCHHNPTGITMSPSRRQALLALAERYGLTIVEDDLYARLSYDNYPPPSLKASDRNGNVIYVDSFSKLLMPGLRVGYLVAPSSLQPQLISLRRAADLSGPALIHRALARLLQQGVLKGHLRRVLPRYRERRDVMLAALQRWMPPGTQWTRPEGGFCIWLTLPASERLGDLHEAALQRGVAVTPGEVFLAEPDGQIHLRLCFGSQSMERIREGLQILGRLLHERLDPQGMERSSLTEMAPLV